ncbi:Chalcone synthase 2 [Triticum urartu]|uniref:Chalcone synthase 2 n=1 Tax=Triticum urartu TaxID=4572 RepID=M7YY87_TRIUA|nr:Chalcone synthase 2 [Triticum urartu]
MATVQQIRRVQRADGPAAVLAIGTANPASSMLQDDYTDYYFRVTNSEHHADLKDKLKRISHPHRVLRAQEGRLDTILGHGIFGDGAGAVILGADPVDSIEHPLFEMVFAMQTTIPETEDEITMRLMKGGLDFHVSVGFRVPADL